MSFDLKKLMPWNWFKKEEEAQVGAAKPPVERVGTFLPAGSDPFLQMQQEMHRLLDEMWRNWGWPTSVAAASLPTLLKPRLDIEERENAYHITLELPGVEEKDIQLTLEEDILWIQAEKRHEVHEREGRFHRIERSYGTFQRALNLPPNADQERIEARFKNGVLTIAIAKKEGSGSKGRVIPIQ